VGLNREDVLAYYRDVLDITNKYQDYHRIIKPYATEFEGCSDFNEIIRSHDRVTVETSFWTYKVVAMSDIVVCVNITSVGIEALLAGKKVFYYDMTRTRWHPYKKYSEQLVSYSPNELSRKISDCIDYNHYIDPDTQTKIKEIHGYKFDGHVVSRFKHACRELIAQSNRNKFRCKW
jgi:hypothetical protein